MYLVKPAAPVGVAPFCSVLVESSAFGLRGRKPKVCESEKKEKASAIDRFFLLSLSIHEVPPYPFFF